jgi:AcrR family transcriptional regulator
MSTNQRETKQIALPDSRAEERIETILAAACRVIARAGVQRARLQDVAVEAGVSKALIHYYFKSREELLARAYVFADGRARTRVADEIKRLESAGVRLRRLLLLYFEDETELLEDWVLWSELSANAVFDPELRPAMEASFANWIEWLEALILEAIEEGSLPQQLDARAFAHRLTAIIDGLGSQIVRGLISSEQARALLETSLAREIGSDLPDERENSNGRTSAPATGYLRLLAQLTEQAVAELEPLTSSPGEAQAVRQVSELVQRVAGGAAANVRRHGDNTSARNRRGSR